jgi:hypothetical protein
LKFRWDVADCRESMTGSAEMERIRPSREMPDPTFWQVKRDIFSFRWSIVSPIEFMGRWSRVSNSQKRLAGAILRHSSIFIVHGKGTRKFFLSCSSVPRVDGVVSSYACFVDGHRKRKADPRSFSLWNLQLRGEGSVSFIQRLLMRICRTSIARSFASVSLEIPMRPRLSYDWACQVLTAHETGGANNFMFSGNYHLSRESEIPNSGQAIKRDEKFTGDKIICARIVDNNASKRRPEEKS